ncbi:MAG: pitrilysin family protein [Candidatus Taylorbacteria bacterium]
MKINKTTLPTGLRLITVPMVDNPSAMVLVMVEAGSKYEDKKTNGLSHFLEHMVFKGTTKRPNASMISKELDSIGAQHNAFTGQEYTGYYAKVAAHKLDRAIDIVSDMYQHPLFDQAEAEKEKGVIIEELRMYEDLPQRHVHDVLNELMFGDQPVGWKIIGTEENIKAFTREQLLTYRGEHYVAGSTIVVVAGSFDEKNISAQIEKAFASIPAGTGKGKVAVKYSQSIPQVAVAHKDVQQTHLAFGIRTFSVFDDRIPAIKVLSVLLGGGMSSRLFLRMREELGICYYVSAHHSAYTDHGDITISAGVDNARVDQAIQGILSECIRLKNERVTDEELRKVKDYMSGMTMLGLETSDARAEFVGDQEIIQKKIATPEERIALIEKVSPEDIQKVAREVFVDEGLNLAVVGNYKDGDPFKKYLTFVQ